MTTVTAEQIAGLVERLREHVRFRYMPAAARLSMDQAAQALTALSDHFADAGKMVTALQERVEGLERERDRALIQRDSARMQVHVFISDRNAAEARADALSAELEGLKKGSSSSRDHAPPADIALDWRPIDSAPARHGSMLIVGRWSDGSPWWSIGHATPSGHVYGDWDSGLEPTHWMPLPAPPSSAKPAERDSSRDTENHPSTNGEG